MNATPETLRADASALYNHRAYAARRWAIGLKAAADAYDRGGLEALDAELARWDLIMSDTAGAMCRILDWARIMLMGSDLAAAEAANFYRYFGLSTKSVQPAVPTPERKPRSWG